MIDDSLMNEFFIDTQGHLDQIEEDTLKLEKSPSDAELIGDVFRRVHSIKGNAGIMGLGNIYSFGQEFEAFLEGVRDRQTTTPAEIEKIFKYLDGVKIKLMELKGEKPEPVAVEPQAKSAAPEANAAASPDIIEMNEPAPPADVLSASGPPAAKSISEAKSERARLNGSITVLTFEIGKEVYGIDIMKVKEIITYERVTRVPNTKTFVDGVMNLRDQVIPVFDLRKKLNIKKAIDAGMAEEGERSIIVVDISKVVTGLAVDDVTGIKVFDQSMVTDPENFTGKISLEYLSGVGQMEDGAVIILEVLDICDPAEMLF